MNKSNKFSPRMRERAVRMVQEHRGEYAAAFAGNAQRDKSATGAPDVSDVKNKVRMGWLMGLEPTTTGITIRDSTN